MMIFCRYYEFVILITHAVKNRCHVMISVRYVSKHTGLQFPNGFPERFSRNNVLTVVMLQIAHSGGAGFGGRCWNADSPGDDRLNH